MEIINNPVFWAVALGFFVAWELHDRIDAIGKRVAEWIWKLAGLS